MLRGQWPHMISLSASLSFPATIFLIRFLGSNMYVAVKPPSAPTSSPVNNNNDDTDRRGSTFSGSGSGGQAGAAAHGDVNLHVDLEISAHCWETFQHQYAHASDLLYIDDFTRESHANDKCDTLTPPVMLFTSSTSTSSTSASVNGEQKRYRNIDSMTDSQESMEELLGSPPVWILPPCLSPSPPPSPLSFLPSPRQRLVDAVVATLPTYVDPDFFASDAFPGSE